MLKKKTTLCQHMEGCVARTDQFAASGYVSRTNHIIVFKYPAPITAFGYCFLVSDVMDHGAMYKE